MSDLRPVVLFVSPVANVKGGAERVLLDMLGHPGLQPALIVPAEGELSRLGGERGIPVRYFDLGPVERVRRPPRPGALLAAVAAALRAASVIAAIARELGAIAIHTNGLKVHVIGILVRRLHRVPVVAHLHDIPHTALERTIWRCVGIGVTRTLVVSPSCWPGRRWNCVGFMMNGSARQPVGAPIVARGASDRMVIGFVGRFHPFKGLHVLLDWFEALPLPLAERCELVIRGRSDDDGAAYWAGLQPRLERLGTRCRVEGWQGIGTDPYEALDVVVVPSVTPDPAPLVLIEAMLSGLPVIGYDAGGIPMLLGGTGYLVTGTEGFVAAVTALCEPAVYEAKSQAGLARSCREFQLPDFWSRFDEQYRQAGIPVVARKSGEGVRDNPLKC